MARRRAEATHPLQGGRPKQHPRAAGTVLIEERAMKSILTLAVLAAAYALSAAPGALAQDFDSTLF
jgi:hypothetical protein